MTIRSFATIVLAACVAGISALATPYPIAAPVTTLGGALLAAGLLTAIRRLQGASWSFARSLFVTTASLAGILGLWATANLAHNEFSPTICHPWTAGDSACRALYTGVTSR